MNRKKGKPGKFSLFILTVVLAGSVISAVYILAGMKLNFHLSSVKKISKSEMILTGIYELFNISTVEYVYKSVFPFDFYSESTNWYLLSAKRNRGDILTAEENDMMNLYDLCSSIGIRLEKENYKFLVITSIIKAGLAAPGAITSKDIVIEGKNITVRLPETEITGFIIEDTDSSEYTYPDMDIDPLHWKTISGFVESKIIKRVLEKGILQEADERLKVFITSFLKEAGFESVEFTR